MGCPSLLPSYTGQPSVESLFVSNLMHSSINPANCMMNMPLKFDINVETKVNLQLRAIHVVFETTNFLSYQ